MIVVNYKYMNRFFAFVYVLFVAIFNGYAQIGPIIINGDKSVTINYYDKSAKEVLLKGTFLNKGVKFKTPAGTFGKGRKVKMKNVGNGYWTYTTEPLPSELYWYHFIVNADTIKIDSENLNIVRDINTLYNYFIVRGGIADKYVDVKDKGGKLQYVWYPTSINGMKRRRMAVYTPFDYNQVQSKRYPVLYLLHGSGGDETAWAECGRLVQIMDNMINLGLCKPMIVVMPNGNVELAAAPGADPKNPNVVPSGNNISSMYGKIEKNFVSDIVNYIDANYRTLPNKGQRAIAGLSLGGLHTLYTALNNPKTFDYIGLFSAQTTNALGDKNIKTIRGIGQSWSNLKKQIPFVSGGGLDKKITGIIGDGIDTELSIYEHFDEKLKALYNENINLFYIAVGDEDFTKKLNDKLREELKASNYKHTYNETDGGHTWDNWRKYLVDFLPRLF